jgi:type I restriction enzyme M protein
MKLEHFASAMEWWKKRKPINEDGFDKATKYSVKELIDRNYNLDLCGYPHEEEEILPPLELIAQYQEKRTKLNLEIDSILGKVMKVLEETNATK